MVGRHAVDPLHNPVKPLIAQTAVSGGASSSYMGVCSPFIGHLRAIGWMSPDVSAAGPSAHIDGTDDRRHPA